MWDYVLPFNRVLTKPWGCGRFSSPLRRAGSIQRTTLPQSRFRSTAPSEREPGNVPHNVNHPPAGHFVSGRVIFGVLCGGYFFHSTGCLRNRGVTGDFHRPYETQNVSHFTIQRTTLPQSRIRSTAPSEREPGMGCAIQPGTCETVGLAGDFHRPYESSECFTFHHSSGDTPSCFWW